MHSKPPRLAQSFFPPSPHTSPYFAFSPMSQSTLYTVLSTSAWHLNQCHATLAHLPAHLPARIPTNRCVPIAPDGPDAPDGPNQSPGARLANRGAGASMQTATSAMFANAGSPIQPASFDGPHACNQSTKQASKSSQASKRCKMRVRSKQTHRRHACLRPRTRAGSETGDMPKR